MPNVKRCKKCGQIWELINFPKNDKSKDGLSYICYNCNPLGNQPSIKDKLKKRGWGKSMKPYIHRESNLEKIGFKNYKEYLKSDIWKKLREEILKRDNYKCVICGEKAINVHHKNYHYKVLIGIKKEYLVPLCRNCHKKIEFEGKQKNGLIHANRKLKKMKIKLDKVV